MELNPLIAIEVVAVGKTGIVDHLETGHLALKSAY